MASEKDRITENLRSAILEDCDALLETDRADTLLITLSFQSQVKPERHVWIDTQMGNSEDRFSIDLEDWTHEGTWDNAVATVETESETVARDVTCSWLRGDPLDAVLDRCVDSTIKRR
jgi:hypothetical protein